MHAEVFQRQTLPQDEGLGRAVAWAVGLHLLLLVLLLVSPYFTWDRDRLNAAGSQAMEATLDVSAADQRAVERALDFQPAPMPSSRRPLETMSSAAAMLASTAGWR